MHVNIISILDKYGLLIDPKKDKVFQIHDVLVKLTIFGMVVFALALCIFVCFDSQGFVNFFVVLPLPGIIQYCFLIYNFYMILYLIVSSTLMVILTFSYGYYMILFYVIELKLGRSEYRCCNSLRQNPENLRREYRAVQILHKYFIALFGPYILIFNAAFMTSLIYLFFVLIRYWNVLNIYAKAPLIVGVFLNISIWTNVLVLGNILSSQGNKVLKSWSKKTWDISKENRIMVKFRRSCKPLLLCYGTQFVIGKGSLFVFCRGVMRGTVRALLTTRK